MPTEAKTPDQPEPPKQNPADGKPAAAPQNTGKEQKERSPQQPHGPFMQYVFNVVAPARFSIFSLVLLLASMAATPFLDWRRGILIGFDIAALIFIILCWPLFYQTSEEMHHEAKSNDANRIGLLVITAVVTGAIFIVVASVLMEQSTPDLISTLLIVATLILSWSFSSLVYAIHYAHMYYSSSKNAARRGGLQFPLADNPDYVDFCYFAIGLSMAFQTSDVQITSRRFRIVTTFHCMAGFAFNIGVIAFAINVLAG